MKVASSRQLPSAKIQSKAEKLVRSEVVRSEVRTEKAITEKEIIDVNAQALVNVKLNHRKSIKRVNDLVDTLFEEIEELSTHKNADNLPVRVDMTKKLMDTLRISIDKNVRRLVLLMRQHQRTMLSGIYSKG